MRRGLALPVACLVLTGCAPTPDDAPPGPAFVERGAESGLDFVHDNGMTGELWIAEVIGSGVALFDMDDDGDLDLYAVQGGRLDPADDTRPPGRDRLYRNDLATLADGAPVARFVDVTDDAGLRPSGYGMGVIAADYDADGRVDLYVTRLGSNQLLRNEGGGRFRDVTAESGTDDVRWSVAAAFFDHDADGHLDLFVGNYVDFRLSNHKRCLPEQGFADYCSPLAYRPEPDRLFRNRGDGTFEDVTAAAGLRAAFGNALGALPFDLEPDGDVDLYVANDWTENQLWRNDGSGRFEDVALVAGAAVNADGQPEASMGVLAEDFDGDGDDDLFLTHLMGETNTLYRNDGSGIFSDDTHRSGLGEPSRPFTGFGTAAIDYDGDGWRDVFVANGAVRLLLTQVGEGEPFPLRQPDQLFRNERGERFVDVSERELPDLLAVGRGVAAGDVDNDGDVDLVVANNRGPLHLLLDDGRPEPGWIGLDVRDRSGRPSLGATVRVVAPTGDESERRRVQTAGSYASSNDPRVVIRLRGAGPVAARVLWPDGTLETWTDLEPDGYRRLERGTGSSSR